MVYRDQLSLPHSIKLRIACYARDSTATDPVRITANVVLLIVFTHLFSVFLPLLCVSLSLVIVNIARVDVSPHTHVLNDMQLIDLMHPYITSNLEHQFLFCYLMQ